ncbi:MAG TPA: phosphotransferase [Solirubrobacteraceae bacterium]|nr:phosphotransferase [Solirubrobacteraceae bacterium]
MIGEDPAAVGLIRSAEEVTSEWLSGALGHNLRGFTLDAIGTGQLSSTYRVTIDADAEPRTVVLKLADADADVRATGIALGLYEREIRFYRDVAGRITSDALAQCHAAVFDGESGYFTLLVEDVSPAQVGDQIAGCTLEQARLVVRELARVHAPVVEDPELAGWLDKPAPVNQTLVGQMLPAYYERFGDRISDEHRAVIVGYLQSLDAWLADRSEPRGIVHGDYRLDNMLFGEQGAAHSLTIIDWATLTWGPVTADLAYFLGGSLTTEDRRAHEHELVRLYHDELVAAGVSMFDWEACWRGYRRLSFGGVLMALVAPLIVSQTERGDDMFMTMLARHCDQVTDLDAISLLAEAARPEPLRVKPDDEGRHSPGGEEYWNESWYLDAVSEDGALGAYVRVGLVPNLGHTVYTAYIVGADRPAIAILDYAAQLPGEGLAIANDRFRSDLICEEPLKRFRATIAGSGESFNDHSAPLRGQAGEPVAVELDLVWETEGEPYQYRIATRYEMPCRVSGTIKIGDEVLQLNGPGQRDHSWGPRDWWAMDWTWLSAHLDDDTRIQGIELRFPELPAIGLGYEQQAGVVTELEAVKVDYAIAENRLVGTTRTEIAPTGTQLEFAPIAFGALRIEAPDGRVCEFPRAMARVSTPDGRTGLGWIEWGHNLS